MKADFKDEYKKVKKEYLINSEEEALAAIEFVRSLLEIQIDETVKYEPYATNWIHEAKIAISKISDLEEYIGSED